MIMKNDDLDKTIPIDILDDENLSRSARYEDEEVKTTRASKYKDIEELEELDEIEEETEELEELEIDTMEVEKIEDLEEDEEKEEVLDSKIKKAVKEVEEETKTKKKKSKIGAAWRALPKKKKILLLALAGIVLVLLIVLIVMLIAGGDGENKELTPVDDQPVEIVDNFYYKKGTLYFLDENQKEIGSYECENKNEKNCYVELNKMGENLDISRMYDPDGKIINQRIPIIDNDYVFIYDSKENDEYVVVLYSIKDGLIKGRYNGAALYDDNYAVVLSGLNSGLIKIEDGVKEVIKPEYEDIIMLNGTKNLILLKDKGYFVVDKDGAELSTALDKDLNIVYYNDNFVVVKEGKTYSVYNYKAEELVSGVDFATVVDEFMLLVRDNAVYIRDKDNVKYNEEGYKLNNSTYVKKYNYDAEGKLVNKELSFELLREEDLVQLLVYKDEEPHYNTLNIAEALANKKYTYMSYFNKRLYFYSDELKEEIIGSVECKNENVIVKESDGLTNCTVASDQKYGTNDMESVAMINRKSMIPVINNKYVFIKDGSDVKLYDLTDTSKPKGTYSHVDSNTPDNGNKLQLASGNKYVIVVNKQGRYALLQLSKENVDLVVRFDYSAMEFVGDYISAKKSDSSYDIYKIGDDAALVTINGSLKGYSSDKKHIKYNDGTSYVVADIQGNEVSSTRYNYVELYKEYYVGIINNKLNIYDYNGNKITSEDLTVGNYAYSRTETPAFKVNLENGNYVVKVYNGSTYDSHVYNTTIGSYNTESVG